jgi:hypothetical protein
MLPIARSPRLLCVLCASMAIGVGSNSMASEQSHTRALQAERAALVDNSIDWQTVEHGSPIPHQMPVADADTALAAGFAPQWIQRSVTQWPPSVADPDLPAKTVQRIASGDRRQDDQWAHEVANRLRDSLRTDGNADVLRYARVFCGSQGCLVYYETPLDSSSLETYDHARSVLLHGMLDDNGWGRTFGIVPTDVNEVGETGVWELIYILRPKPRR